MRLLYDSNGTPRVIEGNGRGLVGARCRSARRFAGAGTRLGERDEPGRRRRLGVAERRRRRATRRSACARTSRSGAAQTALVSGGAGGAVGELAVGRSGLGDGLVAFRQGPLGNAAIVAAQATAPPVQFVAHAPERLGQARRSAASPGCRPTSADGPLSYRVVLDGRPLATPAGRVRAALDAARSGSGRHRVQVLATDIDGQATLDARRRRCASTARRRP